MAPDALAVPASDLQLLDFFDGSNLSESPDEVLVIAFADQSTGQVDVLGF